VLLLEALIVVVFTDKLMEVTDPEELVELLRDEGIVPVGEFVGTEFWPK
jgi:hypothetical protein